MDADQTFTVTVSCGKARVEVQANPSESGSDFRRRVETELGFIDGGLKLLNKGKMVGDKTTLSALGVVAGSKIMGMKTGAQHAHDRDAAKLEASRQRTRELDGLKESMGKQSTTEAPSSSHATKKEVVIQGDEEMEGLGFVIVQKGRDRYRVNVLGGVDAVRLKDIKVKVASFIAGVYPAEVRLLYRGRVLSDDNVTLSECAVASGGTLMAMFSAPYHDRREASAQLDKLRGEVDAVERAHESVIRRVRHRLLPQDELIVVQSQLRSDVSRVRGNIEAVQGFDEDKPALLKRLDNLDIDFT